MRAELMLWGKTVSMAQRKRRRVLVVAVYVVLAAVIAGCVWLAPELLCYYPLFTAMFLNQLLLGGYYHGGLLKLFNNKPNKLSSGREAFPFIRLGLRAYYAPEESDWQNDERELWQRDRAHYLAYQAMLMMLLALLLVFILGLAPWHHRPLIASQALVMLLVGSISTSIAVAMTLPQAILLWTEPDMESEFSG